MNVCKRRLNGRCVVLCSKLSDHPLAEGLPIRIPLLHTSSFKAGALDTRLDLVDPHLVVLVLKIRIPYRVLSQRTL